jgi:methionyl-tRNA synthetase
MTRSILVTSALPYANGPIHIGHLVEYVQTDVWARFQRLRGHRCVYLCADDTHGTALMVRARQEGRREEDLIAETQAEHEADFRAFGISVDHYGSTHSPENHARCAEIWTALQKAGMVVRRDVTQLFDPQLGVFLADRFVKGTCPRCGAADQYGDSCDKCGSTYAASDVKNPVSTLSGATPEIRSAPHLFVEIERLRPFLAAWSREPGRLQPEIANFLAQNFLSEPLRDWDVSRPAPYFGFEIPAVPGAAVHVAGQFWYVWFDAPIGYVSTTEQWARGRGLDWRAWWQTEEHELHHFIGKDIVYFHTLFWPAMLKTAGYRLPTRVHVHGFLNVNGEKMSKSKGTFITAAKARKHVEPAYLRYYFASKLTAGVDDFDLNTDDLALKVNSDIVGKVVNLASRTARFVEATGLSETYPADGGLFARGVEEGATIAASYEARDSADALRRIMALADRANEHVEKTEPWKLKKAPGREKDLQDACSIALNLFRQIAVYLAPVLPDLAAKAGALLNTPITSWSDAATPLSDTRIAPFVPMAHRLDPAALRALFE